MSNHDCLSGVRHAQGTACTMSKVKSESAVMTRAASFQKSRLLNSNARMNSSIGMDEFKST
jgi:hypothetical protein